MSEEDKLLKALGALEAELRETDRDDHVAVEPLSPERKQALMGIAAQLFDVPASDEDVNPAPTKPARVASLAEARARRSGWTTWLPALAASVAIAVGAWWFVQNSTDPATPGAAPSGYAVPSYGLELGGDKTMRGPDSPAPSGVATYAVGSQVELILRPESAPETPLQALAWRAASGSTTLEPWTVELQSAKSGAFRLAGSREALFPAGEKTWDLIVVLAPKAALPAHQPLTMERVNALDDAPDTRVLRAQLRVQ